MHIFFSGIGGSGISSLAVIARQAGHQVSGSDKQSSKTIDYLKNLDISDIYIGQDENNIKTLDNSNKIDWFVYSSAVIKENKNHPELVYAQKNIDIISKRDDLLNFILEKSGQKLIAIAGTHGKTTTTAMVVWLFKELEEPISYSIGGKISFGDSGHFNPKAKFFIYEADEYDKNFLSFNPYLSIISGIDYDHPDIYPTRQEYYDAFSEFIQQSTDFIGHKSDLERIGLSKDTLFVKQGKIKLIGEVNRKDAQLAISATAVILRQPKAELVKAMNKFPGVYRRFEQIGPNIYSDYAHTPDKIRGAIKTAQEVSNSIVIVYEGLHNTRQHFIKKELEHLFDEVEKLYIVPSYLAREDESLELLTPPKLKNILSKPEIAETASLGKELLDKIHEHSKNNDLVLCLTAGGGGSLDEWLRKNIKT